MLNRLLPLLAAALAGSTLPAAAARLSVGTIHQVAPLHGTALETDVTTNRGDRSPLDTPGGPKYGFQLTRLERPPRLAPPTISTASFSPRGNDRGFVQRFGNAGANISFAQLGRAECSVVAVGGKVQANCRPESGVSYVEHEVFGAGHDSPALVTTSSSLGLVAATRRRADGNLDVRLRRLLADGVPSRTVTAAGSAANEAYPTLAPMSGNEVSLFYLKRDGSDWVQHHRAFDGELRALHPARAIDDVAATQSITRYPVALPVATAWRSGTIRGAVTAVAVDRTDFPTDVVLRWVRVDGTPIRPQVRVGYGPSPAGGLKKALAIASAPGGSVVVLFDSYDGRNRSLRAALVTADGTVASRRILQSGSPANAGSTYDPSLTRLPDGRFVAVWCNGTGVSWTYLGIVD